MSSLLPPNCTPLERALAETLLSSSEVPVAITGAKFNPDFRSVLQPYLVYEWGLTAIEPYLAPDRLLSEGLAWSRIRGTVAAVEQALGWIGLDGPFVEEEGPTQHFHEVQLDPGRLPTPACIPAIQHLAKLSLPARVVMRRIYHGYDLRPLTLDRSRLDDALLDDDSGVDIAGVKLSFGTRHAAALLLDEPQLSAGMTRTYSTRVWDDNSWRLDGWALDSEILIDAAGGMVAQLSTFTELEADEPSAVARLDEYAFVSTVADESTINTRTDTATTTARSDTRGWTGPWSGSWRELIPTRTTFEEA